MIKQALGLLKRKFILLICLLFGASLLYCAIFPERHDFNPVTHTSCLHSKEYDLSLSGKLILMPQEVYKSDVDVRRVFSTETVLFDLKTGQTSLLDETHKTGNYFVSPDGKSLAYVELNAENEQDTPTLVVRSYKGGEKRFHMQTGQSIAYWLGNDSLVLAKRIVDHLPEVSILNLTAMEINTFTPGYPNVITGKTHYWFWDNTWPAVGVYSPDQTRVIYPDNTEYFDPTYIPYGQYYVDSFYANLVLYDEESQRELLQIPQARKLDEIQWKRDGSGFFLASDNIPIGKDINWEAPDIRFIDRDGGLLWKIKFSDINHIRYGLIYEISLSPDERYLGVQTSVPFFFEGWALFINPQTGDIYDYCLPEDYPSAWSPDSKSFVFAYNNDDLNSRIRIMDIENEKLYQLIDGYVPVGWVK